MIKTTPFEMVFIIRVTLDKILSDQDLMDKLTHEHHKCVYDYGCDADWSAQNACDCEPGIV